MPRGICEAVLSSATCAGYPYHATHSYVNSITFMYSYADVTSLVYTLGMSGFVLRPNAQSVSVVRSITDRCMRMQPNPKNVHPQVSDRSMRMQPNPTKAHP